MLHKSFRYFMNVVPLTVAEIQPTRWFPLTQKVNPLTPCAYNKLC